MSKRKKLIKRFKSFPSDFTFDETVRLFAYFGYSLSNKGATSGSRIEFIRGDSSYILHRPHPGNTMKIITLKGIYKHLKEEHLL